MKRQVIFEKPNVLILGGAGFIGSHLCDRMAESCKVICVDNFSTGFERNIDHLLANANFRFINHDLAQALVLEDYPELNDFKVEFQGVQQIYNLACPTSPLDFAKNRVANLLANSLVIKNALDLALKYQAKFLHFSSSVVYGSRLDDYSRINEGQLGLVDQLSERASYDEGKRFAESFVKTYSAVYQLDAKIIRLFRVYGPRLALNVGHMIPDFIANALDNKDLIIYGDENFKTSLCYIDDVLSAAIKIMGSEANFNLINIGSDVDLKITDVAQEIIRLCGSSSKLKHEPALLFMTSLCIPDISLAKQKLDWLPMTTLQNGLQKTIENLRATKGLKTAISS